MKLFELFLPENCVESFQISIPLTVLDDFTSKTSRESMKNTIAGPGNNRFPDKSFSMIIGQDSSASFTFEHGWGDGKAIDSIGNQVFNYLKALEDNKEKFLHIF